MIGLSQHYYIHVLYFNAVNGSLVIKKVFEVFILYMDMVASFGHVTKLICWNICSCNQWGLGMTADYNWWFCQLCPLECTQGFSKI